MATEDVSGPINHRTARNYTGPQVLIAGSVLLALIGWVLLQEFGHTFDLYRGETLNGLGMFAFVLFAVALIGAIASGILAAVIASRP